MPSRLPIRPNWGRSALLSRSAPSRSSSVCFLCSLSPARASRLRQPRSSPVRISRRWESTTSSDAPSDATKSLNPRKDLEDALIDLQKHAANYVNLSRIQLALNSLRQPAGQESIRVAVYGLSSTLKGKTAKDVLKLLLADPLKDPQEWEKELDEHSVTGKPVIVRFGQPTTETQQPQLTLNRDEMFHEIKVSSVVFNGRNLEILLVENSAADIEEMDPQSISEDLEENALVPKVDIPISTNGQYSTVTTPVHKALLVADGIQGAGLLTYANISEQAEVLHRAVDLPGYQGQDLEALPFTPVDVKVAAAGLAAIRQNVGNAMEFEHLWFQSRFPKLLDWLKAGLNTSEGTMREPVRLHISSLLNEASLRIIDDATEHHAVPRPVKSSSVIHLEDGLAEWAQSAHSELQEELDQAFASRRWRRLSWWKLLWRVDDVGMISTDILSQRFLPAAERKAIFLAGKMDEAGVTLPAAPAAPTLSAISENGEQDGSTPASTPWPTNIPLARAYLQSETVPALQALAQKLVAQTLGTSGLTTALGALVYVGTLSTSFYEAGAVAALGIVWSMRRMQKKWEAARSFWEAEVREEGRKAVRDVEGVVGEALRLGKGGQEDVDEKAKELQRAQGLVEKAEEALARLK